MILWWETLFYTQQTFIYFKFLAEHLSNIWQPSSQLVLPCWIVVNAFVSPWASAFVFAWQWEGWVRVVRPVIRNFRWMYLIKFLKSLLCRVLRFVRTLITSFWRFLRSDLRSRYIRQINMESDDECELDSTWEDEYKNKEPRKKVSLKLYLFPYCNYATFIHWILFRDFIPFYTIYCSSHFLLLYEKILQTTVSFGISVCV